MTARKVPLFTLALLWVFLAVPVQASHDMQCPATLIDPAIASYVGETDDPNVVCIHLTASDGFVTMADGRELYMFGFQNVTDISFSNPSGVLDEGILGANSAAPTIVVKEGQELYLSLTTVPMKMRPDLFDPHTVHWHGFPNASSIFDGEPMSSLSINQGATLTYYYNVVEPGTYMYHCHVEASEHMQMGMLGNLYVMPGQDGSAVGGFTTFAYNDGDGSTGYDAAFPIQVISFDPVFHDASQNTQPLPFADMHDTYPLINGRGYPDTTKPGALPAPVQKVDEGGPNESSQPVSALITAATNTKLLLRLSSLATVDFYTLQSPSLPMQVVGKGSRIFRGGGEATGTDLYYQTNSITLGGGEAVDVLIDLTGVNPGTYFLYSSNLNNLSNDAEEFGGMMTEIVVTTP